jgi:hypothetical protein
MLEERLPEIKKRIGATDMPRRGLGLKTAFKKALPPDPGMCGKFNRIPLLDHEIYVN